MSESGGLGPDDPDDMAPAGQGVAQGRRDRLLRSGECHPRPRGHARHERLSGSLASRASDTLADQSCCTIHLFSETPHATRLRCRTSRRSTSVVPRHSPVIESSVSAYSSHCRRIGHVSPSSPCLPVVGSRPRTKSSDPGTRQAQRDVRRFHDQYSQVKTPSFSSETLAVCEPRKAGCEGGDVEIPLTPPPGPPALLAHRTGIGASRSRDMFRGSAHVSL